MLLESYNCDWICHRWIGGKVATSEDLKLCYHDTRVHFSFVEGSHRSKRCVKRCASSDASIFALIPYIGSYFLGMCFISLPLSFSLSSYSPHH